MGALLMGAAYDHFGSYRPAQFVALGFLVGAAALIGTLPRFTALIARWTAD